MAWRVAYSLNVLLGQLNELAPNRNKASDGSIGDPAHSSRLSDHNPDNLGIVRARDFTHDPAGGLDCQALAEKLVESGDSRIKYIIWNRRIWFPSSGWSEYTGGPNPHTTHLHLSVVADGRADETTEWEINDMTRDQAAQLLYVYNRLRGVTDPQRYLVMDQFGVAHQVAAGTSDARPERLLGELDGNTLVQLLNNQQRAITTLSEQVESLRAYVEGLQ
jgi:hypothetical protein